MRPYYPIRVYDDSINKQLVSHISAKAAGKYMYGWRSNSKDKNDHGHWHVFLCSHDSSQMKQIHDLTSEIQQTNNELYGLWTYLQRHYIGNKKLHRVYINGYTYGTDGYLHRDDPFFKDEGPSSPYAETLILYLNEEWDANWGGETSIFTDQKEIQRSILPKFGRLLIFDGQKLHASRPLSRCCGVLRRVLVFKTLSTEVGNENIIDKLYNITINKKHSGKTFFEHLINTNNIAIRLGADDPVADACNFHSIYGTEFYNDVPTGITRDWVVSLIGAKAEELVHIFCNTKNRFDAFVNSYSKDRSELNKNLLFIEYCNLLEQTGGNQKTEKIKQLIFSQ